MSRMVDLSTVSPPIALGPLDGRYRAVAAPLVNHLSEAALNRARLQVEVEWLIHLTDTGTLPGAPALSETEKSYLRGVVEGFGAQDIAELAVIEAETRHDVKAVEYLLKRRLAAAATAPGVQGANGGPTVLPGVGEIVHIFCTSEDINNLSYALTIRAAITRVGLPAARGLVADLGAMAREHAGAAMLSRTHGQAATPTTVGKELAVTAHRLGRQLRRVEATEYLGKINGATGTYGAHVVSVPGADWQALVAQISAMAEANRAVPMLSRTHGQPATPTTLGKELAVIAHRLTRQLDRIAKTEYLGKINGATGTYGAHVVSVPGADWQAVARSFVESLGLTWNPLTTQIESHDWQAELYSGSSPMTGRPSSTPTSPASTASPTTWPPMPGPTSPWATSASA